MTTSSYEYYRKKAKEAFFETKFEKALKYYGKALKKHRQGVDEDNLEEVHVNRAVCFLGLDKYEESIEACNEAIAINSQFSKAFYRKAEASGKLKRYAQAQDLYSECLALNLDRETRELVLLRKQVLRFEEEDDLSGIYFRYLIPGVDYCNGSTFNPITSVIYEIGAQMRNIIYLIGDRRTGECVVIDPCWDVEGILREVRKDGMSIVGVIQTHNHFDHVGGRPPPPFDGYHITVPGTKKLLEKVSPNVMVHVHQQDADVYQSETEIDPARITCTVDGQIIKIGETVSLRLLHTPGHTPGSQCIMLNEKRLLTGDTLFVRSCGRTDLPGGDPSLLRESLLRIAGLPLDTLLFPAHLYSSTIMTTVENEVSHGVLGKLDASSWEKLLPGSNSASNA